jgi:hypothetical protein
MVVTATLFGWPGKHLTATCEYGVHHAGDGRARGANAVNAVNALSAINALPTDFSQMR